MDYIHLDLAVRALACICGCGLICIRGRQVLGSRILGKRYHGAQHHDSAPDQPRWKILFEHWPIHVFPSPLKTTSLLRSFDARNLEKTLTL
jgi:hypothetical protein